MKVLLSGNEAVARGAYEFGVRVAVGYPGTPSTEILENIVQYPEIYAQWSPNEKVALEMGIGASLAGARTLVTMKHVGLNVAADPLMTLAYTGVNGGLVIITADDPGMHSSQNEQDNRFFAKFAQIPLLEPADSHEAKEMVGFGMVISESFDTPVLLRLTTRISHSKSLTWVEEDFRADLHRKPFARDPQKYVMIPAYSRKRRALINKRTETIRDEISETTIWNSSQINDTSIGIITGGVAYQYAREVLPHASFLKLGMSYPLPEKRIRKFAAQVEKLYVVEELTPFIEDQVRLMGLAVEGGRSILPDTGELSPDIVARAFGKESSRDVFNPGVAIPPRPPAMCPGCPHRGLFYTLNRKKIRAMGDIGCYTLSVMPPLEAMDMCICMGASIGAAHGFNKAIEGSDTRPVVGVIGDSTFCHSGITGLLDIAYNQGTTTVIILDNRTTAMTGFQQHPGTGRTLKGRETRAVDLVALAKAMGISRVEVVDPYDLAQLGQVIDQETATAEPSLIISRRPCVLLERNAKRIQRQVDPRACTGCRMCLKLGCPAMSSGSEGKAQIDPLLCNGCPVCEQVCKAQAIKPACA
ncbi:MAG: indolepyruvate ferredoxin oxidoreductase subunit alpha [bacterium]